MSATGYQVADQTQFQKTLLLDVRSLSLVRETVGATFHGDGSDNQSLCCWYPFQRSQQEASHIVSTLMKENTLSLNHLSTPASI
jgi:hypothetical protein